MNEISVLYIFLGIAVMILGPGGGVYIGLKAAQNSERELRTMALKALEKSGERIELSLNSVVQELRTLNNRVSGAEGNIKTLKSDVKYLEKEDKR